MDLRIIINLIIYYYFFIDRFIYLFIYLFVYDLIYLFCEIIYLFVHLFILFIYYQILDYALLGALSSCVWVNNASESPGSNTVCNYKVRAALKGVFFRCAFSQEIVFNRELRSF